MALQPINYGAAANDGTGDSLREAMRKAQANFDHLNLSKVSAEEGKSLMTEAERAKLSGIATGAQVNVATDLGLGAATESSRIITSSTGSSVTLPAATASSAGLMTAAESSKLSSVATHASANSSDAFLLNRANHSGTQPVSTIAGLEAQTSNEILAAIAMAKTFTAVPAEFQSWVILVTQPHLRQMVWSIAKNKYVRAPWHPVGKAGYFLREVGEGFLQVRGDVVLQTADFPDLAEYLGVTGPTFVLDEARAEFIRNADSGRGKDAGRVIGSHQGDAIRNISGSIGASLGNSEATGAIGVIRLNTNSAQPQTDGPYAYPTRTFDASRQVPTASENRPTNLAYIFAVTF